jgi:hypothetical protein
LNEFKLRFRINYGMIDDLETKIWLIKKRKIKRLVLKEEEDDDDNKLIIEAPAIEDYDLSYPLNKLLWLDAYSTLLVKDEFLWQDSDMFEKTQINVNLKLINSIQYLTFLFTKFQVSWHFINLQTILDSSLKCSMLFKLYRNNNLKSFFTEKYNFIKWITTLSLFKDPTRLVCVLKKRLTKARLSRHQVIFMEFSSVLNFWFENVSKDFNITGYSIFFKGKLGKKGSVRKSIFFSKKGYSGFSNNNLRFNHRSFIVITETGVIGGGVTIFF